ncbi:uroporphyrinogen-III C-methyltransferase [Pseudomonas sp. JM0905a]|uniref:uroporphyrinogen-III C-methyltransferase n=1 Tax=Pseudomonas sp. JM0905a TaxID=2772484 RepID=UPI001689C554|nr:uroporphyrinogen-III C-methyltransferase [Pseudomonas sp. JM0905a]MBD2837141.1 uroporphyrinogen-III C-methyltransferase [Pseudomonas sp. JM0905a]
MSEAEAPNQEQHTVAAEPVTPASVAPAPRGNGLALFALLLGAAGIAVGSWGLWQVRTLESRDQQQLSMVEDARGQTRALAQREQQLTQRLEELPSAAELDERRRLLVDLQGDQQQLRQRLETILGASRKDWRLAEAEHLLRLASLRLSALRDIHSATALVQAADDILREQDDPGAYAAREQLAKSLAALRSTEQPDRTGLFLQLGALREQAAQLNPLVPSFEDKGGVLMDMAAEGDGGSAWAEWLEKLSHYFRIQLDASQDIKPLLAGQSLSQVRLALSLALEQAQWGALHGQTQVYQQSLRQAREVLNGHFNEENPDSRALLARLDELAGQPVEVQAPDLAPALSALQAYLQRAPGAAAEDSEAPAAAEPAKEAGQ